MFVNGRYLSEAGYWTKTFGLTWCSSAESTEEGCVVFFVFFFLSSTQMLLRVLTVLLKLV